MMMIIIIIIMVAAWIDTNLCNYCRTYWTARWLASDAAAV